MVRTHVPQPPVVLDVIYRVDGHPPPALGHPRNSARHTALLPPCSARPTTRPRQKINVPCNPCIMHSYFVRRTNERTARKFTSHLAPGRERLFCYSELSLCLPFSLPLSCPPSLILSLSIFLAFSLSLAPDPCRALRLSPLFPLTMPRTEIRARKRASPDQLAATLARSLFRLRVSLSPVPALSLPWSPLVPPRLPSPLLRAPRPADPASSKFRLEIIKLHALTRTCVVRTDGPLSR